MNVPLPLAPHWLRPAWLFALLALPLLAWAWRRWRARRSAWQGLVDPRLLPHLLDARAGRRGRIGLCLALVAYGLAVCALAGPSWQRSTQPLWRTRAPLVVALDLSSATLAGDLPPSRLAQARAKIAQLLQARAGGQIALVAYAGDAFTVAPLTDDSANVALLLDALAPDIMPVDGSDAARAIRWSAKLLGQADHAQGDILLLTDHADAAARAAAGEAARAGYRVSALGLGTAQGAAYRDREGAIGQARLDPDALRTLARAGGGAYAPLGPGDLAALGVLDPRQGGERPAQRGETAAWQDQGYWLLPPLLALAAFAFRRGGALAAFLLCLWLPWQPARAADDWWRRPDQQAHARLEQGAQAYRQGKFDAAAEAWRGLPGADAAYNLGNALAKEGDYDGAIAAYDRALRIQPNMTDAAINKDKVMAAQRQQRHEGGKDKTGKTQRSCTPGESGCFDRSKKGYNGQPNQKAKEKQSSPTQQHYQDKQSQQNQNQSRSHHPDGRNAQPQPAPPDPQAQRQADAAQRARMQAALQRGRAGTQADKAAQRVETPAQREQRLADEAWLRRIPDDPGGLLRARFRIEYERRQQEGGAR